MGKKDTITKDYMKDNAVFADVFNYLVYKGESVIKPENLRTLDTTMITISQRADGRTVPLQKFRDEYKGMTLMEDGETVYLLLGIENQSEIHYAMPVKDMMYDAMEYTNQVDEIARKHRKENLAYDNSITSGEFLTGFYKDDVLIPVITLVVYFGAEQWNAPKRLHEMFGEKNEAILQYIPDYKINLIAPAEMTDEEIARFQTDFREIMLCIKYSKNKKKLRQVISGDERFKNMDFKTAKVISAITGTNIKIEKDGEKIDMCQAIDEMIEDGRIEGRAEGKAMGIRAFIEFAQEYLLPYDALIEKLSKSFELTREEAENYVDTYGCDRTTS